MKSVLFVSIAALIWNPPATLALQSDPAGAGVVRFTEVFEPASDSRIRRAAEVLTPVEIEHVQEALGELGHLVYAPSGILDSRTESALSRFQIAADLPDCGCVSYSTVLALGLMPVITEVIITGPGTGPLGSDVERPHGVEVLYTAGIEQPVVRPVSRSAEADEDGAETGSDDASVEDLRRPIVHLVFPFVGLPGVAGVMMGPGGD